MTYTFKLARRLAVLRHGAAVLAALVVIGCSGDATAPDAGPVPSNVMLPLRVVPSSVTIEPGQRVRFRSEVRGGRDLSLAVAWQSTGGSIDPSGMFSASQTGTYKVVGRSRGHRTDTATVVVVQTDTAIVSLKVTPDTVTLATLATFAFAAQGVLSDGSTVPVGVTWQATGGSVDPAGTYTAGDVGGTYRVIATNTAGTLADTSKVTVTAPAPAPAPAPTLTQVYVTPSSASLLTGGSQKFAAYGRTSAGDSVAVSVSFAATGGSITSTGAYTAGSSTGTYRVVAASSGLADTSSVTISAPPTTTTVGTGIPFGPFHLPDNLYGVRGASGALKALEPAYASTDLASAKSKNMRLVISLPGSRSNYTNSDGTFNLSMWESRMSRWASYTSLLKQYSDNGTIILNYLVDEPDCKGCWGGQTIPHATLQEMTRYAKTMLPFIPTVIRVTPGWLKSTASWPYLDAAWVQYEGPLHYPCAGLTPDQCAAKNATDAKAINVALVFGMNTINGGDGSSRINGTYALDPNLSDTPSSQYRYQMSAAEVLHAGSVFAAEPSACAVIDWRYSATMTNVPDYVLQFDLRSDVQSAMTQIGSMAAQRATSSCRKPGT